jgi:hypothetical protein
MSGYQSVLQIHRIEAEVSSLGLMLCNPSRSYLEYGELVAVKPKDKDSLPVYARDAELFVGSIEQLEVWLRGVKWARQYDELMCVSNNKKRERKEQDLRNKNLLKSLKDGKIVDGTAGANTTINSEDC